MKLLILAFGAAGLIGMFISGFFSLMMEADKVQAIIMLAVFGLPTAMGALGLAKPPFQMWQAIVALAAFGLGVVKMEIWSSAPHIMDMPLGMKLMVIGIIGGVITSLLAVLKPEGKA
jgi:hypothetical protein